MSDKNIEEYLDIATGRFVIDMFPEIPDFLDRRQAATTQRQEAAKIQVQLAKK